MEAVVAVDISSARHGDAVRGDRCFCPGCEPGQNRTSSRRDDKSRFRRRRDPPLPALLRKERRRKQNIAEKRIRRDKAYPSSTREAEALFLTGAHVRLPALGYGEHGWTW